jgi:hypothetical protein
MKMLIELAQLWSQALLQKPPIVQLLKNFPAMEPKGSLPYSQEPFTGPYSEPDQSNPYHTLISL